MSLQMQNDRSSDYGIEMTANEDDVMTPYLTAVTTVRYWLIRGKSLGCVANEIRDAICSGRIRKKMDLVQLSSSLPLIKW